MNKMPDDFNTTQEIFEYLCGGGKVCYYDDLDTPIYLKDGMLSDLWYFDNPSNWRKYLEPKQWYEEIPEGGVLCMVWGDDNSYRYDVVIRYNSAKEYPFITNYFYYRYALPIVDVRDIQVAKKYKEFNNGK